MREKQIFKNIVAFVGFKGQIRLEVDKVDYETFIVELDELTRQRPDEIK